MFMDAQIIDPQTSVKHEVWEIFGPWWKLPVRVRWIDQNDVAAISFCEDLPLLQCQQEVIKDLFKNELFRDDCWWVHRKTLERVGHIATQDNLELTVVWRPPPATVTARPNKDPELEEFLARLVEIGYFKSIEQADAIRRIFCKAMLDQLLNQKKPVDLLFCKLWPVPYRPNWKQVILQRDIAAKPSEAVKVSEERVRERIDQHLESGAILAMVPTKVKVGGCPTAADRILWTLDVEYYTVWWKMVAAVEKRARFLAKGGYAFAIRETMRKFKVSSGRLYKQFLEQIGRPNAKFLLTSSSQYPRSVQPIKINDEDALFLRGAIPRDLPDVLPRARGTEDCTALEIPGESEGLRGVSDLQPDRPDLRDIGEDLLESDHPEGGA